MFHSLAQSIFTVHFLHERLDTGAQSLVEEGTHGNEKILQNAITMVPGVKVVQRKHGGCNAHLGELAEGRRGQRLRSQWLVQNSRKEV